MILSKLGILKSVSRDPLSCSLALTLIKLWFSSDPEDIDIVELQESGSHETDLRIPDLKWY